MQRKEYDRESERVQERESAQEREIMARIHEKVSGQTVESEKE